MDRYAVVGNPIAHSLSPRIHALFARQTGQDLHYGTLLSPLDGFAATVRTFADAGGVGLNVTVPFKEEAYRLAGVRSARAEAAGAVNTLRFDRETIFGDNTDGAGLVRDLTINLGCPLAGRSILLLGAGGAARGVLRPLLDQSPRSIAIANRSADKARRLAEIFPDCHGGGFADLAGQSFDLIINATSAGLADAELPLPKGIFAVGGLAYEMVYGKETAFLRQARNEGARCADGLGMLVEQAAEAFRLWRGIRPQTGPVLTELRRK